MEAMRTFWFIVIVAVVAFLAYVFFGSALEAIAQEEASVVTVQDQISAGTHELSGQVFVPSECHDLTVRVKDIDAATTALIFETWKQPYRECVQEPVPRVFRAVAFAPIDVVFKGIYDGELVPLEIITKLK